MPGLDILVHLQRHGITANEVKLAQGRIAEQILDHCEKTQPDVLVMGAYGRGNFTSALFGSLTRTILEKQNVPVLLSH